MLSAEFESGKHTERFILIHDIGFYVIQTIAIKSNAVVNHSTFDWRFAACSPFFSERAHLSHDGSMSPNTQKILKPSRSTSAVLVGVLKITLKIAIYDGSLQLHKIVTIRW